MARVVDPTSPCARSSTGQSIGLRGRRSPADRYWAKVDKTGSCWLWTGSLNSSGYGLFGAKATRPVKLALAHRYGWELCRGPIPDGMLVLHSCDTPACVRPDHLSLGTNRDNMRDARDKGRLGPRAVNLAGPLDAEVERRQRLAALALQQAGTTP